MTQDEIDKKRKQIESWAKYGGLGVLAVILTPLIFVLALGALGTVVAGGVAVVAGIALVNFLPVFGTKMANWKLKSLKAEARKNPIETMEQQILASSARLDAYAAETKSFISKAKALEDDVREMRKEDPEGADGFNDHIKANALQIQMREEAIRSAVEKIETAKIKLKKAKKRWEMTQKHQSTLNASEKEATMDQILIDEAMDQVMADANKATSNLIVDSMVDSARTDFKNKRNAEAQGYLAKQEASMLPIAGTLGADAITVEVKEINK